MTDTDTFIADTPVGRLHRGDIVWYRRYNRVKRTIEVEWATASGRSTLNSRLLFARGSDDKPRVIRFEDITNIKEREAI